MQAPDTEAIYLDVALEAGAEFEAALPPAHNAFAYAHSGDVQLGEERSAVERGELAVLSHGERLAARAGDAAARFILVAGKPLARTDRALRPDRHEYAGRTAPSVLGLAFGPVLERPARASGNRTRVSGSRPLPSITGNSLPVRGFAFFECRLVLQIPTSFA